MLSQFRKKEQTRNFILPDRIVIVNPFVMLSNKMTNDLMSSQ